MAKSQDELNAIKEEVKTLNKKIAELTEDELKQVCGGWKYDDIEVVLTPDGKEEERH